MADTSQSARSANERSTKNPRHLAGTILGPEMLMLAEDVAPLVGMARSTLAEHCRRGRFPCRRSPGTRRYLFPAADVQAYSTDASCG